MSDFECVPISRDEKPCRRKRSRNRAVDTKRDLERVQALRSVYENGDYIPGSHHRERECLGCKSIFPVWRSGQTYCGRSCAFQHRVRNNRKYVSKQEAKRAENARAAARRRALKPKSICISCTCEFIKKRTEPYCSVRCKPKPEVLSTRKCIGCSELVPYQARLLRCGVCQAARKKEIKRRHRAKYGDRHRRRARYHGVAYEPVNVGVVFDRDQWRCQICGINTPKRLRGTYTDNAPELDHRIPMAMGGHHSYENVQLACRKCNSDKGATIVCGQLSLFPKPAVNNHLDQ